MGWYRMGVHMRQWPRTLFPLCECGPLSSSGSDSVNSHLCARVSIRRACRLSCGECDPGDDLPSPTLQPAQRAARSSTGGEGLLRRATSQLRRWFTSSSSSRASARSLPQPRSRAAASLAASPREDTVHTAAHNSQPGAYHSQRRQAADEPSPPPPSPRLPSPLPPIPRSPSLPPWFS